MKIEISVTQYSQIQNEIIRLEEKKSDEADKMDGWDYQDITDEIQQLKIIVDTEVINLKDLH